MKEATKAKILSAARELYRRQGCGGVSMRAVAAASGLQVGNVTYYFRHKEELVEAVFLSAQQEVSRREIPRDVPQLDSYLRGLLRMGSEAPYLFLQEESLVQLSPGAAQLQEAFLKEQVSRLREAFENLRLAGLLREEPPGFLGCLCVAIQSIAAQQGSRRQRMVLETAAPGRDALSCLWILLSPALTPLGRESLQAFRAQKLSEEE